MSIPVLGQMWYVAAALVGQENSARISTAHRGRSLGCCKPGQAEQRKVPRSCRGRVYSVEACGRLLPCPVSIQFSGPGKFWKKRLTEVIDPPVSSLSSSTSGTKYFLKRKVGRGGLTVGSSLIRSGIRPWRSRFFQVEARRQQKLPLASYPILPQVPVLRAHRTAANRFS